MLKHILCSALFGAVLPAAMLCGCNKAALSDGATETSAETQLIAGESASGFVIIRADESSKAVTDAAVRLRGRIKELCGTDIELKTDWLKAGVSEEAPLELLVGATNRAQSRAADSLYRSQCLIKLDGGKLIVAGGSDALTAYACEYLLANYAARGTLAVPSDLNLTLRLPAGVAAVPAAYGRLSDVVVAGSGEIYFNYENGCVKTDGKTVTELNSVFYDRASGEITLKKYEKADFAFYADSGGQAAADAVNASFGTAVTPGEIADAIYAAYLRCAGAGIGLGVPDGAGIVTAPLDGGKVTARACFLGGDAGTNSQLSEVSAYVTLNPETGEAYAVWGNMIFDGTDRFLPTSDVMFTGNGSVYQNFKQGYCYSERGNITATKFISGKKFREKYSYFTNGVASGGALDRNARMKTLAAQVKDDYYTVKNGAGYAIEYHDQSKQADCWGYGTIVTMFYNLYLTNPDDAQAKADYISAVEGLCDKKYAPYAEYDASLGLVSYDDMIWFMRMWLDAYEAGLGGEYLDRGLKAAEFLVREAWAEKLGCFYWCDGSAIVAPVSNAPLACEFVRLYMLLDKAPQYKWLVDYAEKAYDWTVGKCRAGDGTYWNFYAATYSGGAYKKGDESGISSIPSGHKFIYLNGCMIAADVRFYELTGDEKYLSDAIEEARYAHDYFALYSDDGALYTYPAGNYNFELGVYYSALLSLAKYRADEVRSYFEDCGRALDYAWEHFYRKGYIAPDYLSGWYYYDNRSDNRLLLDMSAPPALYALIARFEALK